MEEIRSTLVFLWSPAFRPIPIPEFQDKGGTLALAKVAVTGGKYEADMQLGFKGKGSPARVARFIVSLGEALAGPKMWTADTLDLSITFPLFEGKDRPDPRLPERHAHDATVMVRRYLQLMQLCGIPYERAPVPRVVLDFAVGHAPARAVPLGKYLVTHSIAELRPELRLRHN